IAWAQASELHPDDKEIAFTREAEYLILARVWFAQADPKAPSARTAPALQLLDRLMADATAKERGSSVLEILIVRALALQAGGNRPEALATLTRGLALAAPEGYVRRFVDEGPALWS